MEFIKENLVLVLTLVSFVVFAIIGYIVDHSKNKDNKEKDILKEDITEEIKPNIDVPKDSKEITNKNLRIKLPHTRIIVIKYTLKN